MSKFGVGVYIFVSIFTIVAFCCVSSNEVKQDSVSVFHGSTSVIQQLLYSFVNELKWQTFLLLADNVTEAEGRNVVIQSLKRQIQTRLIGVDDRRNCSSLILTDSDLQKYKNVIIFCGCSTLKKVLKFVSQNNLISQYFHWVFVIPKGFSYWKTRLSMMTISKPENVAILSFDDQILSKESYAIFVPNATLRSSITWTRVGSWTREQNKLLLEAPILQRTLDGLVLNLGVINDPPYCIVNETTSSLAVSGMDIDAMNIVAEKLKFRYRLLRVSDNNYGTVVNGTWGGLAGAHQRKEVDLTLPTWRQSTPRRRLAHVSYPISSATCSFLIRRPLNTVRYTTYLLPFTGSIWLFFLVTSFVFVPILWFSITTYFVSDENSTTGCNRSKCLLIDIVFMVLYMIAQKGLEEVPSRSSSRIVLASFLILMMLLMWCYSSALVALLTLDNGHLPFNSLHGLVQNSEYKVGHIKGIVFEEFTDVAVANKDPTDIFVQLSQKVHKYKDNLVETNFNGIEKAYAEKYAYFSWMDGLTYDMGHNCSFMMTTFGRQFFRHYYGVPFTRGSPHVEHVSRVLVRMKETGILDHLHRKYFPAIDSYCKTELDGDHHLGLFHFIPLFTLLALGLTLSIIGLGMEFAWFRYSLARNPRFE